MSTEVEFTLETATAGRVASATIDEALDRPYRARVILDVADPQLEPHVFLGQSASLAWGREAYSRKLHGIVCGVRILHRHFDRSSFELEIEPAFALLELTRNTRMFQGMSAPEIIERVLKDRLGPYSRDVAVELEAEYASREYCLQYQESDRAFVERLMEEEGIGYAFEHDGGAEVIVLRDTNASYPRVPQAADPVLYRAGDQSAFDEETISRLDRTFESTTTAVALRDHDFTAAGLTVEDSEEGADDAGLVRESYEHGWGRTLTITGYDAGAQRYQENDAAAQKRARIEAHRARERVLRGTGRVVGFAPGTTFAVVDHPGIGFDGEYLVTAVVHESAHAEGGDTYHNTFECVPLETPHRPRRRRPKPRIPSIQTAVVTGPSGEEIHTDEHGRIKVRFHWDRDNPADETSSAWVRVQQKWAGAGWGFFWLPRIGMEVVVEFIDGDPDRPLVTGAVYNAANPTPYQLPADKTKSTIKSNSTPGGGGFNEWRFEDATGSEQVFTHAQKDYNEVVENDHTTEVGHDQTIQVDNDQTQTIHANQTEDVAANQTMTVDGDRSVHVEGDFDETVSGTETRTVTGAVTETFDSNETRDVGGSLTETLGASETRSIGANQAETIGASRTVTIGASSSETVGAALDETIAGGITSSVGANWEVTATGGFNVTAPAGVNLTLNGPFQLAAPGGVIQVDAGESKTASFVQWKGALSIGGTMYKDETYALYLGFTAVKIGRVGAKMPNLGINFGIHPNHTEKDPTSVECGALELISKALYTEG